MADLQQYGGCPPRPNIGAVRFEMEWYADVPKRDGELDFDSADCRFEYFDTVEEARQAARQTLPNDFFGAVRVRREVYDYETYEDGERGPLSEWISQGLDEEWSLDKSGDVHWITFHV